MTSNLQTIVAVLDTKMQNLEHKVDQIEGKIDHITNRVDSIEKKLAYYIGGATAVIALVEIIIKLIK